MHPLAHRDERGASAVEYGMIVFAIAAVITVTVFLFGEAVQELFADSCQTFETAASTTTGC